MDLVLILLAVAWFAWPIAAALLTVRFLQWLAKPYRMEAHHAALHLARRLLPVRRHHILHHGRHHPVNPDWHTENTAPFPHLPRLTHQELWDRTTRIKRQVMRERRRPTSAERIYVKAMERHFNARTVALQLKGRQPGEFGGAHGVDQLHMGIEHAACGCILEHVFDERNMEAGNHPHHPLHLCEMHEGLKGLHPKDVHARVHADEPAIIEAQVAAQAAAEAAAQTAAGG